MKLLRSKRAEGHSFKQFLIYFLLTGLFITAIVSFATEIGTNYDRNLTIGDKEIDLTTIQNELSDAEGDTKSREESFKDDKVQGTTGSLIMFSIWGVIKSMFGSVATIFTVMLGSMHDVLGLDPIVTGTISTIIILSLIFAAWRSIKTGD